MFSLEDPSPVITNPEKEEAEDNEAKRPAYQEGTKYTVEAPKDKEGKTSRRKTPAKKAGGNPVPQRYGQMTLEKEMWIAFAIAIAQL